MNNNMLLWLSIVQCNVIEKLHTMDALIILCTKLEVSWFLVYFGPFSFYQMTTLHLAVESNDVRMVKCLLDQAADINFQDKNEVILHTNAV